MKKAFAALVLALILAAGSGCTVVYSPNVGPSEEASESSSAASASSPASPASSPSSSESGTAPQPSAAERLLANMSTEEKVGQLFVIRPDSLESSLTPDQVSDASRYGVTALSAAMETALAQYPVGGVAFFQKNITSPEQLTAFVQALQSQCAVPLLTGIDEEGGQVARIANSAGFDVTKFGSMEEIGSTGDSHNAYRVGLTIGTYLRQYGFCLDFAPVADVNTNPKNIVIGARAFGSDPSLVADMVAAEISGLHDAGVMSCVKHFPGHGDTTGDTHDGYVSADKTWQQLLDCELIPFCRALPDTDLVMAAHITVPNVTDDGLPGSLSHELITEKLRGELGYQGVVITDSLAMGAITKQYTSAESAVQAVLAGDDLLLMPLDFTAAYRGVLNAVQNGTISESRLDESVLRILRLKEKYGLLD